MLPAALKQQFVEAIRRLLRPIVRQLITYGVSYPAFNRLVREVYVEVAEQHFALPFKRQTDSRVALVTGINRKEIAQVRERIAVVDRPRDVEDTAVTHVIGRWMAGPPYTNRDGEPRRLPYEAAGARLASFARLVRELGIDVPVRSVLDELLRVGAVELLSDGDVVLRREVFIPPGGAEGKLTLLGSDPGELFTTIVHNIEAAPERARLQRKVVYDNVGADALPALHAAARELGEDFVRQANALLASYDRDRNPNAPGGNRTRVALATYYFEEDVTAPHPPRVAADRPKPPGRIRRSR